MMKKNIVLYITVILTFVGLAGCNTFLDTVPDSRTEVNTPEKIKKLLVSAYSTSSSVKMFENMSDNVNDNGDNYTFYDDTENEAYQFDTIVATNQDTPFYNWQNMYKAIAAANLALEAIEELEDPSVCNAQKGEALLCRAWAHLELAKIFCQPYNSQSANSALGLPYSKEIETTAIVSYERGLLGDFFKNIYEDIEEGLPLIVDTEYSQPKYHFNRRAAYSLAAEFNLYYGNYEKARDYATIALGAAPKLRDMVTIRGLSNSSGDTRNQYISTEEEANYLIQSTTSTACCYGFSAYNRYTHTPAISNGQTVRSPGPWGTQLWCYGAGLFGSAPKNILPKLYGIFEITNVLSNTGYYHTVLMPFTADKTLLNRAEAYIMDGLLEDAAADLNLWYSAKMNAEMALSVDDIVAYYRDAAPEAVAKPLTYTLLPLNLGTDQEYMIQAVLHARRIETLHEGIRLYDLKRWGIPYTKASSTKGDFQIEPYDLRLAILLPADVVSAGMQNNAH